MPTMPEAAMRNHAVEVFAGEADALPSPRTVVIASADTVLRERLAARLARMRWSVREAGSGGEAIVSLDMEQPEVLLLDHWLPDLDVDDLQAQMLRFYPGLDLLRMQGEPVSGAPTSSFRHELAQALREAADEAVQGVPSGSVGSGDSAGSGATSALTESATVSKATARRTPPLALPGMVGASEVMLELARLVRLLAPRSTAVLIEGETGTGKEVVAHALHHLSARAERPMVILNCAAIPEALLEAELFGHTRGAFTGAVGARVGRLETAHGGTLFLDEIGEMPQALQAKMLRFLECGELQRVGENEVRRVDVRVLAATHQPLEQRAEEGSFRLDLYHRLAVFPIEVPALRERKEDLGALAEFLLARVTKGGVEKRLTEAALAALEEHSWPGNVRELAHVLERAVILSGSEPEIDAFHIRCRRRGPRPAALVQHGTLFMRSAMKS